MDKVKALELMTAFPKISEDDKRLIRSYLRPYIIVDNTGNGYCTHCEEYFDYPYPDKHRSQSCCPECGVTATVIRNHHNFSGSVVEDNLNFVLFLSNENDRNAYATCVVARLFFAQRELKPIITFTETQRYIFMEKTALRFGRQKYYEPKNRYWIKKFRNVWELRTKYTEPQFESGYDNGYNVLCPERIKGTCLEHSAIDIYHGRFLLNYLNWYRRHKGAERLIKCGLSIMVASMVEGGRYRDTDVDWTQTEPHRMLKIDKEAFKAIRQGRIAYDEYLSVKKHFPAEGIENLIRYNNLIRSCYGFLDSISHFMQENEKAAIKYLIKQGISLSDYSDYMRLVRIVGYDHNDIQVRKPKDFHKMHDRLDGIRQALEKERKAKELESQKESFEKLFKKRKKLEFSDGDLMVIQPESLQEIVAEGQALKHCVGGYTARHAEGRLTIMFLRRKDAPKTPYYTIEVSDDNVIRQCRGYKNNWEHGGGKPKTEDIKAFEKHYQEYLDTLPKPKAKKKSA